jgi:hypothetical protein
MLSIIFRTGEGAKARRPPKKGSKAGGIGGIEKLGKGKSENMFLGGGMKERFSNS